MSKIGNVAKRCILYQKFAEGGVKEVNIPALWTENNQIELNALRNAPIKMAGTSYGCFLAQHKRDVERVYWRMFAKENVDFKWKMADIYKVGADDGQPPSPSHNFI